jgi:hypothetical protein
MPVLKIAETIVPPAAKNAPPAAIQINLSARLLIQRVPPKAMSPQLNPTKAMAIIQPYGPLAYSLSLCAAGDKSGRTKWRIATQMMQHPNPATEMN